RQAGQILASKPHPPGARWEQPEDRLDQRRLARPVPPDPGDDLALSHGEVDPVEDVPLGDVAGDKVIDREKRAVARGLVHCEASPCAVSTTVSPPRYASITRLSSRTSCGWPSAITFPSAITTTRSEWFITTSMSCSMNRKVTPSSCR